MRLERSALKQITLTGASLVSKPPSHACTQGKIERERDLLCEETGLAQAPCPLNLNTLSVWLQAWPTTLW
jgi:hypothetical protein